VTTPATQIGHHHTDPPPLPDSGARRLASAPGRAFSARELASMIGVPLLWAILLLFHPAGDGKEMYLDLHDKVTPTLVVHLGMLLFIPLMAIVAHVLLRGLDGTAARISRIALAPFAQPAST
jgi:hypothetical protein